MSRVVIAIGVMILALTPAAYCQQDGEDQEGAVLARKVTLCAKAVTLRELCDQLTEQTGVKHTATREIAGERLTVMATDVPLGELHDLAVELLRVRISRNDTSDGRIRYEMWRDTRSRKAEAILVGQAWSKIAGEFRSQAQTGEIPVRWKLPEYIKPLREVVAGFSEQQVYRMVENKSTVMPYWTLTPEQRRCLIDSYEQMDAAYEKWRQGYVPDIPGETGPPRRNPVPPEEIEASKLKLRVMLDLFSGRCMLRAAVSPRAHYTRFPICELNPREVMYLPVRGCPYSTKEGENAPESVLPKLEEPVSIPQPASWEDMLDMLHDETGVTLLSDYFLPPHMGVYKPVRVPARIGTESLPDELDTLCKATDRLWWEVDGSCLFRTQLWYVRRLYEVPREMLESWEKKLQETGQLGRAELDQIAKLTARQIEGLASSCGQGAGWDADDFSEALDFYRALSRVQKDELLREGLGFPDLSPPQQDAFLEIFLEKWPAISQDSIAGARLSVLQAPPEAYLPRRSVKRVHHVSFSVRPAGRPAPPQRRLGVFISWGWGNLGALSIPYWTKPVAADEVEKPPTD